MTGGVFYCLILIDYNQLINALTIKDLQARFVTGLEIILNNKKFAFMATPIKITPVLKDESSHRFNKMLVAQQNQKVSREEKKRIESLVASVLAKSKLSK